MPFIIACDGFTEACEHKRVGFELFLYHVHALFQQLHSYNNLLFL